MLTTITFSTVSALAGIAIGASAVSAGGLRRRVRNLEGKRWLCWSWYQHSY